MNRTQSNAERVTRIRIQRRRRLTASRSERGPRPAVIFELMLAVTAIVSVLVFIGCSEGDEREPPARPTNAEDRLSLEEWATLVCRARNDRLDAKTRRAIPDFEDRMAFFADDIERSLGVTQDVEDQLRESLPPVAAEALNRDLLALYSRLNAAYVPVIAALRTGDRATMERAVAVWVEEVNAATGAFSPAPYPAEIDRALDAAGCQ